MHLTGAAVDDLLQRPAALPQRCRAVVGGGEQGYRSVTGIESVGHHAGCASAARPPRSRTVPRVAAGEQDREPGDDHRHERGSVEEEQHDVVWFSSRCTSGRRPPRWEGHLAASASDAPASGWPQTGAALDRVGNWYERRWMPPASTDRLVGGPGWLRSTVRPSGTGASGSKRRLGRPVIVRWAASPS
jgi:hypothetical protein